MRVHFINCCCWLLQFQSDTLYIMYFGAAATVLSAQWRMCLLCVLLLVSFFCSHSCCCCCCGCRCFSLSRYASPFVHTTPSSMHTHISTHLSLLFIAMRLLVYGIKKCKHAHTRTYTTWHIVAKHTFSIVLHFTLWTWTWTWTRTWTYNNIHTPLHRLFGW